MNSNPDTNGSKKGQKLVVIGGVAGGASFAARARRLDETAEIVMLQVSRLDSCRNKKCDTPSTLIDTCILVVIYTHTSLAQTYRLHPVVCLTLSEVKSPTGIR